MYFEYLELPTLNEGHLGFVRFGFWAFPTLQDQSLGASRALGMKVQGLRLKQKPESWNINILMPLR